MITSFIAVNVNSYKLINGFQMVYCTHTVSLHLLIWEKLPFALGCKGLKGKIILDV